MLSLSEIMRGFHLKQPNPGGVFTFTGVIPAGAVLVTFCWHLYPNAVEYEQIVLRAKVYEGTKWRRKSKKEKKEEINWAGAFFDKSDSRIDGIRYP